MTKKTILFIVSILLLTYSSCRKEFDILPLSKELSFSKDTVYLDTVFSKVSSSTRILKVYNRENNWVKIENIHLGRGANSFYRLNVDGQSSNDFFDVEIAPKDSIYIFIEATIDFSAVSDPLYTDSIVFKSASIQQSVKLVTLVQDAVFLFPEKGKKTFAVEQSVWTAQKPYVIYGYAVVDSAKTLTVEKGTKIHFHNSSGLIVYKDASLRVEGSKEEKVIFEGDRLEPAYSEIPGQWGMIWIYPGSYGSTINHCVIKNGSIGLRVDSTIANYTTLSIKNTEIYNHSSIGIAAQGAKVIAENTVVNNCGDLSLLLQIGGEYEFKHCTFANFYSGYRQLPAVYLNNWYEAQDGNIISRDLISAGFYNCIIDGNNSSELLMSFKGSASANYHFKNNLIKFDPKVANFEITNDSKFENSYINKNADFWDAFSNDLRIGDKSEAKSIGDINIANLVPFDIEETPRNQVGNIDIGAYQSRPKPNN